MDEIIRSFYLVVQIEIKGKIVNKYEFKNYAFALQRFMLKFNIHI